MNPPVLFDTNVVVYLFDPRDPAKQQAARQLLETSLAQGTARLAHQSIVEFVAATTRVHKATGFQLLKPHEAYLEADNLLATFPVLFPNSAMLQLALRGAALYPLSWFDAHMWACAEHHGIHTIYTEGLQHGGRYGSVQVINPFAA